MRKIISRVVTFIFFVASLQCLGQQKYKIMHVHPSPITIGGKTVGAGDIVKSDMEIKIVDGQYLRVKAVDKKGKTVSGPSVKIKSKDINKLDSKTIDNIISTRSTTNPKRRKLMGKTIYTDTASTYIDFLIADSVTKRVALVIGIDSYDRKDIADLDKPMIDAKYMQEKLSSLGFNVRVALNLNGKELKNVIDKFLTWANIGEYTEVLIYFSGHGLRYEYTDYLLACDAKQSHYQIKKRQISVEEILKMVHKNYSNRSVGHNLIIIYDACRVVVGGKDESISKDESLKRNEIIFYASIATMEASQGFDDDSPSPFTAAIIEGIGLGGDVYSEFKKIREELNKKQIYPSIVGEGHCNDFYFKEKSNGVD